MTAASGPVASSRRYAPAGTGSSARWPARASPQAQTVVTGEAVVGSLTRPGTALPQWMYPPRESGWEARPDQRSALLGGTTHSVGWPVREAIMSKSPS